MKKYSEKMQMRGSEHNDQYPIIFAIFVYAKMI